MSAEENRSASNLILMCPKHADEIDLSSRASLYPVSLLREWKATQMAHYDSVAARGFQLTDDEAVSVLTQSETKISFVADTINLGGAGGINGGSGGGGAAIGPGAIGGTGGPVGRIDPNGKQGAGPGSGGGGGGVILPAAVPFGVHYKETVGHGHSSGTDGNDGGDTVLSFGDQVFLRAKGGVGGLAGCGVRGSSDRLKVSALLLINSGEINRGLVSVLGAGWNSYSVLNVPIRVAIPYLVFFEAGGIQPMDLTASIEFVDPAGKVCATQRFPVTIERSGDVLRIPRIGTVAVDIHSFGLWSVAIKSEHAELARINLLVRRTGEAE